MPLADGFSVISAVEKRFPFVLIPQQSPNVPRGTSEASSGFSDLSSCRRGLHAGRLHPGMRPHTECPREKPGGNGISEARGPVSSPAGFAYSPVRRFFFRDEGRTGCVRNSFFIIAFCGAAPREDGVSCLSVSVPAFEIITGCRPERTWCSTWNIEPSGRAVAYPLALNPGHPSKPLQPAFRRRHSAFAQRCAA